MPRVPYDEFAMFHENAEEWSLPYAAPPVVERIEVPVAPGRHLSALRWGQGSPQVVLLHGGAQNAHTFDTVALALGRPLLAVDLPGHGHSDAAPGGIGDVEGHARDVAALLGGLGIAHVPVVGMSLGGMVALTLASQSSAVVSRLGLIDVTPGVTPDKAKHITDFVAGPATFKDLDELVARTVAHNPTRSERSLRRGVLHNSIQLDDGSWVWRHQRHGQGADDSSEVPRIAAASRWDAVSSVDVPLLLVRAMGQGSVVDDADEAELLARRPGATVVHVEGSGHSVQGDQPLVLAAILATFLDAQDERQEP
jgi:pimeloyl-ACP methyl ester carboxylesterase